MQAFEGGVIDGRGDKEIQPQECIADRDLKLLISSENSPKPDSYKILSITTIDVYYGGIHRGT